MSTEYRTPQGPPWDVDDVADVHAGLFPAEATAELLARIKSDPDGAAILAALDSTVDDLSLLPPLLMPEKYVMRVEAALFAERRTAAATRPIARERLGALLAPGAGGDGGQTGPRPLPHLPKPRPQTIPGPAESSAHARAVPTVPPRHQPVIPAFLPGGPTPPPPPPPHPVRDLGEARERATARAAAAPASRPSTSGPTGPTGPSRLGSLEAQRRKRRRWTTGVLAAAAVAGVGVITAVALNQPSSTGVAGSQPPVASAPAVTVPGDANPGTGALQLDPGNLTPALASIEGRTPAGVLSNLGLYTECLKLNAISPDEVTGATEVTWSGSQAVAIVVKDAADATRVRVVVVGTNCGTSGNAAKLAEQTVTR